MAKVAVVGRKDRVMCFLASGFRVYDAADLEEAKVAVESAENDGCDVIFVSPDVKGAINWADEAYGDLVTPAVVPLPLGDGGEAAERLSSFVERAVGADILSDN